MNKLEISLSEVEKVESRLVDWRVEAAQLQASFNMTKNAEFLTKRIQLCEQIALGEEWLAGQRVKKVSTPSQIM